MFDNYNDVLNVRDVCEALGIGKNSCYELLKSGAIKSIRIGNIHKIPKVYLIEYVMSRANSAAPEIKSLDTPDPMLYNVINYNSADCLSNERSNISQ